MPVVWTDAGEIVTLALLLNPDTNDRTYRLRLFKNSSTIGPNTVEADLESCDFDGYEEVTLDPDEWSFPATVSGRAKTVYGSAAQQWTNDGDEPQTVYGYYVFMSDNDTLMWGENFADPIEVAPGGTIQVWPEVTARSEY